MESIHRLSMNTSLKNARIFDDDAWDDSGEYPVRIKKECPDSDDELNEQTSPSCVAFKNASCLSKPIKQEKNLNDSILEEGELEDSYLSGSLNAECEDPVVFKMCGEGSSKIKTEQPDPLSQSQMGGETGWVQVKPEKPKTPPPPRISDYIEEQVGRNMFNESPYNKDLFEKWRIKETTPVKFDEEHEESSSSHQRRACYKSAKRTVFNRPSPYKTSAGSTEAAEPTISINSRLWTNGKPQRSDINRSKSNQSHIETDPECLARREKQIEYGKNTVGYENYLKLVPKSERKPEDPKTPPKYRKYSRRGWEGLVKQWRIQLHKYDPPETPDS